LNLKSLKRKKIVGFNHDWPFGSLLVNVCFGSVSEHPKFTYNSPKAALLKGRFAARSGHYGYLLYSFFFSLASNREPGSKDFASEATFL